MVGLEGAFLHVNSAWKTSLGWPAEAMTHRSFASLVHPDDRTATEHLMRQLVAGGTVRGFVNRVRSAAGTYRTLAWHAERVGEQVYASARDVTELRRENETLRALAATAAVGRWEIDHVYAVADASAEARTIMDLSAVETLGSVAAFLQRVAPDDRGFVGADRAQGYGLGRPMPADAVPAWVEAYGRDAPLKTLQRAQGFDQHELFVRVALRSHTLWVDEMRRYRDDPERVPPPPLHPRACAFGAWYAGSGNATYGARPEYAAIGSVHEDLHAAADRLVDAVRDGQTNTAHEAMHALERAHQRLVAGLERLMALR